MKQQNRISSKMSREVSKSNVGSLKGLIIFGFSWHCIGEKLPRKNAFKAPLGYGKITLSKQTISQLNFSLCFEDQYDI